MGIDFTAGISDGDCNENVFLSETPHAITLYIERGDIVIFGHRMCIFVHLQQNTIVLRTNKKSFL